MNESLKKRKFGDTLFSGSRFIFWCLGPLFLLVALSVAFIAYTQFAAGRFLGGGVFSATALVCLCFFLALLNGTYFWWAGRVVSASVFGAYLWYLLDTWLIHPKPLEIGGPRSGATPWNALLRLVIIGWPCLCYSFCGRFTLRAPPPPDESLSDYHEEESADQNANDKTRKA